MVKKVIFIVMAVAIVATGAYAFMKLNYWERSVRIFSSGLQDQRFEGRMRGGPDGFGREGDFRPRGEFQRPPAGEMPDSVRARLGSGRRTGFRQGERPGSLQRQFSRDDHRRSEGAAPGIRNGGDGHQGRGEFPGGKRISLGSVMWFLAVFAGFTLITVYLDKAVCLVGSGKRRIRQVPGSPKATAGH